MRLTAAMLLAVAACCAGGAAAQSATFCWGAGGSGQLGNGATDGSLVPVAVDGGRSFTTLAAGKEHTCGLVPLLGDEQGSDRGNVWCWVSGCLLPAVGMPVGRGRRSWAKKVAAAASKHPPSLAPMQGLGTSGQLGRGSADTSNVPVQVTGGRSFDAVAAGGGQTCGIEAGTATAFCWVSVAHAGSARGLAPGQQHATPRGD